MWRTWTGGCATSRNGSWTTNRLSGKRAVNSRNRGSRGKFGKGAGPKTVRHPEIPFRRPPLAALADPMVGNIQSADRFIVMTGLVRGGHGYAMKRSARDDGRKLDRR